ncbi:MAG: hypothetical protein D6780_04200 [Candidatus Dadabacteria bacterium]|nr:MAG: hypothetical protein D6780_04200 [Candidatus Dadabacteria bacterium]
MAAKKKSDTAKKLVVFIIVLAAVEGAILYFSNKQAPQNPREAIEKAIEQALAKTELSPNEKARRKAQLLIQQSVLDYRSRYGKFPESLNELIPEYFSRLPTDPLTGKPFKYLLTKNSFRVILPDAPEKGKEKRKGKKRSTTSLSVEEQVMLLEKIQKEDEEIKKYVYNPAGKRDPFEPFNFAPKENLKASTPLERYDLGQLKVTAILEGFGEPRAIVEDAKGHGYTVKKGTKIGIHGGEVADIQKDKIVVVEEVTDFTGKKKTNVVEMKLRRKSEEKDE